MTPRILLIAAALIAAAGCASVPETSDRMWPLKYEEEMATGGTELDFPFPFGRLFTIELDAEPWEEESRLKLADVRAYMQHLNVPLVVWVIGDRAIPAIEGTEVQRATSFRQLQKAKKRLSEELDRQRIVWLEGRHLPTSIQVSATAAVVPAG